MNENRMNELKISLDDFMLDPNNPRFVQKFDSPKHIPDDAIEGQQNNILNHFIRGKAKSEYEDSDSDDSLESDSEAFFDIEDLWNSMSNIGLVPIDRIVVRKLNHSDKYLVIEGNRRVATAKQLLKKDNQEINPQKRLRSKIIDSLTEVETICFDTEGLSQEEVDQQLTVILGLRHHGSVLEWNPLPKAYNTYKEYLGLDPRMDNFEYKNKRANDVASRLSVRATDVRKACMTYIVYRQLSDTFEGVKPSHYSLIETAVTNKTLTSTSGYFVVDSSSFQMDEASLYKMNELCQFDERDNLSHEDTIPEPRHFRYLADLVKACNTHENESVRGHAAGLLVEVESGARPAESAADSLKHFINQKEWAQALNKALDKQDNDLNIDEFNPIAMELTYFKEVTTTFERLRRVLEL